MAQLSIDFSQLLDAVDVGHLIASLITVGAVMIMPRIVEMGVHWIKGSIDGGMYEGSFDDHDFIDNKGRYWKFDD